MITPNSLPTSIGLRFRHAAALTFALVLFALVPGCSRGQSGAFLGAGLGALAGQAIGGDTEATLLGTAIGAGAGYVIGNEQDKSYGRYHTCTYSGCCRPARPRYRYRYGSGTYGRCDY